MGGCAVVPVFDRKGEPDVSAGIFGEDDARHADYVGIIVVEVGFRDGIDVQRRIPVGQGDEDKAVVGTAFPVMVGLPGVIDGDRFVIIVPLQGLRPRMEGDAPRDLGALGADQFDPASCKERSGREGPEDILAR